MALLNDDFDNLSLFYENNSTVIFRGTRKSDGVAVFLKSHKNPDEMFRIKHEYDLLSEKEIKGASHVLDISYNDDKNYLVLKDTGAVVLDDYIAENEIDLPLFLKIAENAVQSLAAIHGQGIIHCDIKPANMLIHPETQEIWFIDFGISMARYQRSSKIEGFAGTLEFMAPEQTGRLNMTVDQRSDLYSLGITLYSILTGNLPFAGETAVELIHAQTVLPPTPISEYVDADPTITEIIMKLMEKAPKKRYQSALSLAHDLSLCRRNLQDDRHIKPFTLGEKDIFANLEPGNKLYGKENLLEDMAGIFHSVPVNASRLILLHGPAESGKSSLMKAFEDYVEENQGYLIKGGFDWKDSGESYSGIREAFEGFELYAYNANLPLPEYKNKIQEALGENTQVLLDIIPSLEQIMGKQAPVMKLNALESLARARQVFQKFIEIICYAPYPFVFVFDNVQWADANSVELLLSSIESRAVGNCVMVLSYRDDDPVFLQEFNPRIQSLNKRNLDIVDIGVRHLTRDGVQDILHEYFEENSLQSRELADIIYNATGGVLPKVRMYLQTMYRAGQIGYEADTDTWRVNFENMGDDIQLDMEHRYSDTFDGFTEKQQDYLCKMACLGEVFDITEGGAVFGLDGADLEKTLDQMEEKQWLVKDKKNAGLYYFTHKTIYDLCCHKLPEDIARENNIQIVTKLYEQYKDDRDLMLQKSTLFTRQILTAGIDCYPVALVRDISGYKLIAANQIMEAANMSQAAKTYENGIKLLGEAPFEADYSLSYQLHLNYALCCFALREFEKASELFEIVLLNVANEDDKYGAYFEIVKQYLSTAEWDNAKLYCKRYLAGTGLLLGHGQDPIAAGEKEYQKFVSLTGEEGILACVAYDHTQDPILEHQGNMLAMLADALLFEMDDKCRYYLYKAINLAVENKAIFSEFTRAYCVGAARYASERNFEKAKRIIEIGIQYAEKNSTGQAFIWCIYGNMINHWVNPLSDVLEIYKKAKYHALMEGNAFYEAYADMMLLNYHSFIGENLEEYHRETQTTLHNLERSRLDALQANFTTFRQYARCLMGRTKNPDSFDDDHFQEDTLEIYRGTWNGIFNDNFYFIYRMRALYIHGYYEKARQYALKYEELSRKVNFSAYLTQVQFYYYYSMTLLELCKLCPEKQVEYLPIIEENQRRQKFYAEMNPLNFEYKYRLVNTGVKGLSSDNIELVDEFAAANKGFVAKGLIWDVVFVERLIGNFWEKRNIPQYVVIHKQNALKYYKQIGAKVLIRRLADVDDEKQTEKTSHTTHFDSTFLSARYTGTDRTQYTGINVALDFQALLAVLENLIKMDTLPSLASKFLTLLMENGNAEKALLFLEDGAVVNLVAAKYAVDSESGFNETELPVDIGIVEDNLLPKKLVELVKNRNEALFANSVRNEFGVVNDKYLNQHKPESFLCMPVSAKGKYLGVVYLENASLPGSFPEGRVRFLQAVVLQASILILNLENVAVMEQYTKDLERRLSSYLGQQNALIAGIAHEINSPVGVCLTVATKMYERTLAVIEKFEQKALSKNALDAYLVETRDGLNIINNNILRAGDLVQNFKKMSVEQSTEVFEYMALAPAMRNIVEYIRPAVKKKIDHIDLDIPEDLQLYSSSGVLAQVFTNLIMNSSIHGFEEMEKDQCRVEIKATELENRDEIEIVYTDNGKGMTEEEQDKVFQPFFTTKRNRGGSGLGGHIVLTNITQTLKGSIRCVSAPGEGTKFVIRLPRQMKDEAKEVSGNE